MKLKISSATRIAVVMTTLIVAIVQSAEFLGLVPDIRKTAISSRSSLAEAVAVQCCLSAQRNEIATMKVILGQLMLRNREVMSAAVRRANGELVVEIGSHAGNWKSSESRSPYGSQVAVPIHNGPNEWGKLEIRFRPLIQDGFLATLDSPALRLTLFVGVVAFLAQRHYLRKILRHLDPSAVIPERVRATLDLLSEGVIILDNQEQIVLGNSTFAKGLQRTPESLQGFKLADMNWRQPDCDLPPETLPWSEAVQSGIGRTGIILREASNPEDIRTVSVSAMPITNGKGEHCGAMVAFNDTTESVKRDQELSETAAALEASRHEIKRRNEELQRLHTSDPLTSCLNRRSFLEKLESHVSHARQFGRPLSCVIIDVDHFKSVNDRFGHIAGDLVLKKAAETLLANTRNRDLVCRFGGEEFCVLMPDSDVEKAAYAAERYRAMIAATRFEGFAVTASLGVAALGGAVQTSQELVEQASNALASARQHGRNRVVRWDRMPADEIRDETLETVQAILSDISASVTAPLAQSSSLP